MNKKPSPLREPMPEAAFSTPFEDGDAPVLQASKRPTDAQATARRLSAELLALKKSGRMPEGFDEMEALSDPQFIKLLMELPVYAAVRVYHAEAEAKLAMERAAEAVSERLYAQEILPKPARAAAVAAPEPDFRNMSSQEFREYERQVRQSLQRRAGA
ncbi:MAG: hypothetical protein PHO41_02415 [Eubacteriales bacterium]|nr:hypothetical protein [Eubacteriales bacterium]